MLLLIGFINYDFSMSQDGKTALDLAIYNEVLRVLTDASMYFVIPTCI